MIAVWLIGLTVAAANAAPPAEATRLDGSRVSGLWADEQQTGKVTLSIGGRSESIAIDDLLCLEFGATSRPGPSPSARLNEVFLAHGGRLRGRLEEGGDAGIHLQTPNDGLLHIDFRHVRGVRLAPLARESSEERLFQEELSAAKPGRDILLALKDGKIRSFRGTLLAVHDRGGRFRIGERTRDFAREQTYGLVFAIPPIEGKQPSAVVCLSDGSIIPGAVKQADQDSLVTETEFGTTMRIDTDRITRVDFYSDRIVYLSDLVPVSADGSGLLGEPYEYVLDQSIGRTPLSIGGHSFTKGIGVRARNRLTYRLDGSYRTLAGTMGIDDVARPRGNVIFTVIGDGRELYNSGPVSGTDPGKSFAVPVDGVIDLTLSVEFGQELDVGDYADWGGVRLIR